jgi:hypothetical protein
MEDDEMNFNSSCELSLISVSNFYSFLPIYAADAASITVLNVPAIRNKRIDDTFDN